MGAALSPTQVTDLESSRVVHVSIDASAANTVGAVTAGDDDDDEGGGGATAATQPKEEYGDEEKASRQIPNARPAVAADGLFTTPELLALFPPPQPTSSSGPSQQTPHSIRSAYDTAMRHPALASEHDNIFSGRPALPPGSGPGPAGPSFPGEPPREPATAEEVAAVEKEERERRLRESGVNTQEGTGVKGAYEPMWTSFTHFWRLTLVHLTSPLIFSCFMWLLICFIFRIIYSSSTRAPPSSPNLLPNLKRHLKLQR